jgi:hypothetical protein
MFYFSLNTSQRTTGLIEVALNNAYKEKFESSEGVEVGCVRCHKHTFLTVLEKMPSRRVVTSTWWEGLVLPMIPRAMPVGS